MTRLRRWVTGAVQRVTQVPPVARVLRMLRYYSDVRGSLQAGGVTYFGFLSVFPILALAFFAVGIVAQVVPEAELALEDAVRSILPGLIGTAEGQIPMSAFKENAAAVGWAGLAGVLYSGLGWLSGMRHALATMFGKRPSDRLNFVLGKLRDLLVLVLIGLTLLLSVGVSAAVNGFSEAILSLVRLGDSVFAALLLRVLGYAVAISATTLLFWTMYRLLGRPNVASRALLAGALLAALGFEVLKLAANTLIELTRGQQAFATFGVALILLVWIYYFSRLVMYGAAWAYTSPHAGARDVVEVDPSEAMAEPAPLPAVKAPAAPPAAVPLPDGGRRSGRVLAAAGVAGVAGLAAAGVLAVRRALGPD